MAIPRWLRKFSCASRYQRFLTALASSEDPDRLLSYNTKQQVNFLDAKLGVTFYFLNLLIASFIVGYIFIYKEGYLELEQAKGATVTHVSGDAVSISSGAVGSRYFSVEELTYPGIENGNVFIATRMTVNRQMRGICEDPDMPCNANSDCAESRGGVCSETGFCREESWCNVNDKPEKYEIASDMLQIWARSFIQYVKLAPEKLFSTESKEIGPNRDYTFNIRSLLMQCEPVPVNYEEVAELGGVFEIGFRWECNVKKDHCTPKVNVRRLDTILDPDNIGFRFKYAEYIDAEHRVQNGMSGLRFFFRTTGVGKKLSVAGIIVTASTSSTLLAFATIIADLLLTKVFANKNKYMARKFQDSPDFSEYLQEAAEKSATACGVTDLDQDEKACCEKEDQWMIKFIEEE